MSLKENISMVKEELSTEEQFFEQAVKTERFVKKYKKPLIAAVAAVALAVIGTAAYDAYAGSKRDAANAAYLTLQSDPANTAAKETLKANAPLLFDAWKMSEAIKSGDVKALQALASSPASEVADVSSYEAAAITKDAKALGSYSYRQGGVYKEMALIDEAVLLMQEGKTDEAHRRLQMIGDQSPLAALAEALSHYGVK
ncbi:hypothetical protein ACXWTF_05145 [Thiomicrolovo sp. ZZH C-3]